MYEIPWRCHSFFAELDWPRLDNSIVMNLVISYSLDILVQTFIFNRGGSQIKTYFVAIASYRLNYVRSEAGGQGGGGPAGGGVYVSSQ